MKKFLVVWAADEATATIAAANYTLEDNGVLTFWSGDGRIQSYASGTWLSVVESY